MKYFFILGTNTALSVAELVAVLGLGNTELVAPDFLLWETDTEINPASLITRLGGIIKIGLIRAEADKETELLEKVMTLAAEKQARGAAGKFNFGFSDYGQKTFNKKDLGLKLKKHFSERKISSRFVVSQEKTLSSVVVTQNRLLARGIEIVLAQSQGKILVGETISVQPFKDLSRRDFGRPARDDLSGMLPPKVAQIMINLAGLREPESVIVDPFCGSGTILSEALLMGYKNLFGSDVSLKAVEDTRKNISWTKELYSLKDFKLKLQIKNAIYLSKFIKAGYVDAVITEPYLGPQRGRIEFSAIIRELEKLYSDALKEFAKILKPGGRVVMIWPSFYNEKPITPELGSLKIVGMIPEELAKSPFIKQSARQTIVYGRPGQKIFREIVTLEKE